MRTQGPLVRPVCNMTTIIACGNLLRGDDGVGAYVFRELTKTGVPCGVTLIEAGTGILDILLCAEKDDKFLIIDAVISGNPPGTIYRIPVNQLSASMENSLTLHDLGPQDIPALGHAILGEEFNSRLVILGVEVKSTKFGVGLSPEVEEALPRLIGLVREEMAERGKA